MAEQFAEYSDSALADMVESGHVDADAGTVELDRRHAAETGERQDSGAAAPSASAEAGPDAAGEAGGQGS